MTQSPKHAHISGGGSGIGLAIAKRFDAGGYRVTVSGRDREKLKTSGLSFVEMDVTDEASIRAALEQDGAPDIFIANAGAVATAPALKTKREVWDRMLAVNLTSVFVCAQASVPLMIDRGWGRFIVIASTASLKGYAYTGAYAAAKHGVLGWIRSLAIEIAKTGVTANAICPGFTDTPMVDNALTAVAEKTGRPRDQALSEFIKQNPMSRLIDPEEIAGAVLWLASDAAAAVNGQALAIDGGETAS